VYQHIRRLDADTDDAAEQAHLSAQELWPEVGDSMNG
jgi:hypothetical protein